MSLLLKHIYLHGIVMLTSEIRKTRQASHSEELQISLHFWHDFKTYLLRHNKQFDSHKLCPKKFPVQKFINSKLPLSFLLCPTDIARLLYSWLWSSPACMGSNVMVGSYPSIIINLHYVENYGEDFPKPTQVSRIS